MIRPLYRWKSFWFGVLVIVFLGWAWWDSMHFSSGVAWREFSANNSCGAICVKRYGLAPMGSRYPLVLTWRRSKFPPDFKIMIAPSAIVAPLICRGGGQSLDDLDDSAVEPAAIREKLTFLMLYRPRENWVIFLPHWLVLLAFVVSWSALLIWRIRKQRKHTA